VNTSSKHDQRETAHYFDELEGLIVERLHREAQSPDSRVKLIRNTGITDPHLIDELSRLGVTADGLVALRLFPVVLVAWVEDSINQEERASIQREAAKWGITEGSTPWILLDTWTRTQPPGIGVDAWKRYIQGILHRMSPAAAEKLIAITKKQMTAVAEASGGSAGVGNVGQKERMMIDRLTAIMEQAKPKSSPPV
jgi:hypothetical protein